MDLLWQINYGEMLSGLMVTTFLILLDASIVVVCLLVMFPLIDLAFKKKANAPRPAQVETWQHDGLAAHTQLSGRPWLALRSDFLRPDAAQSPLPLVGMAHHALAHPPIERITPLIVRSLVPKGSEGRAARSCNGTPLRKRCVNVPFPATPRGDLGSPFYPGQWMGMGAWCLLVR